LLHTGKKRTEILKRLSRRRSQGIEELKVVWNKFCVLENKYLMNYYGNWGKTGISLSKGHQKIINATAADTINLAFACRRRNLLIIFDMQPTVEIKLYPIFLKEQ